MKTPINWKIEVLNTNGTIKATYNNIVSAGIVSKIMYSLEPGGNCLNASFDGIPSLLNIQPRDFINIYIDDTVTPMFYGYVTTSAPPESKEVHTYQLEGAKKLLFEITIDNFWFTGTPMASGLTPLHQTIAAIGAKLPSFVASTIQTIDFEPTSGNVPPIVANNYSLGKLLDDLTAASTEADYVWGVNGQKQVFVAKINDHNLLTEGLDVTASTYKILNYSNQSADEVVTAVKFIFTIPESFTDHFDLIDSYTEDYDDKRGEGSYGMLSYEYEDTAKVEKYGKFTRVVPLILSDSWIQERTISEWTALSVDHTSVDHANANSPFVKQLISSSGIDVTDAFGIKFTMNKTTSATFNYQVDVRYANYNKVIDNMPMYDRLKFSTTSDQSVFKRIFFMRRPLTGFKRDPFALTDGKPDGRIDSIYLYSAASPTSQATDVADFKVLGLNKTILNQFAKTQIKVPSRTPAKVELVREEKLYLGTQRIMPPGTRMIIDNTELTYLDSPTNNEYVYDIDNAFLGEIVRVDYELSRQNDYLITYTLGYDEKRENAFLTRLFQRDRNAEISAVLTSKGVV